MNETSHLIGQPPPRRCERRILLLSVTLLAAALRIAQSGESLWLDELHTAWTVAAGPDQLSERAAMGNQSPLFFYAVWGITATCGLSEFALRSLSLLGGIALIPCLYLVVSRWTGSSAAGFLAALLAALDHNCIFYAQEARPYAWVQLLGLMHLEVFRNLVATPHLKWRLAFVGLGAILFYLHYTAILLVTAEMAYYAAASWKASWKPRLGLARFLTDLAILAILLLPAAPHLAEIAARRGNWRLFVTTRPSLAMRNAALVYLAIPFGAAIVLGVTRRIHALAKASGASGRDDAEGASHKGRPTRVPAFSPALLTACWLVAPVGVAWAATYVDAAPLFFLRYVIVSALAPLVAASLLFASRPARWERVVLAALLVAGSLWASGMIAQVRKDGRLLGDRNEDWRGATGWINSRDLPALPVLVRSGLIEADSLDRPHSEAFRQYCLLPVLSIYRVERPLDELIPLPTTRHATLQARARRLIQARGGAWLLVRGDARTASVITRGLLPQLGTDLAVARVEATRRFGGVGVVRIAIAHHGASTLGK